MELLENSPDVDLAVIDVDTNIDLVQAFEVKAVPGKYLNFIEISKWRIFVELL